MKNLNALLPLAMLSASALAHAAGTEPALIDKTQSPAAAAAPSPSTPGPVSAPVLEPYGFLLANYLLSGSPVSSLGRENLSAPTEAGSSVGGGHSSVQVQQSRFGLKYNPASNVHGKIEIDFLDTMKASPTTQALPRLRILKVEYQPSPDVLLFAGQDWDLFSPLGPFGYNYVGGQFRAGNAGFLRPQLGGAVKFLRDFEFAASIGLPTPNAFPSDQAQERGKQPVLSAKLTYSLDAWHVGASAIYSRYGYFTPASPASTIVALPVSSRGINFFAEWSRGPFAVKAEAYAGRNLANLNLLTIGQGTPDLNALGEQGGYVSARYRKGAGWGGYFTLGRAHLLDPERVDNAATKGSFGVRANTALKAGVDYGLGEKLRAFYELSFYRTRYVSRSANATLHTVGMELSI